MREHNAQTLDETFNMFTYKVPQRDNKKKVPSFLLTLGFLAALEQIWDCSKQLSGFHDSGLLYLGFPSELLPFLLLPKVSLLWQRSVLPLNWICLAQKSARLFLYGGRSFL